MQQQKKFRNTIISLINHHKRLTIIINIRNKKRKLLSCKPLHYYEIRSLLVNAFDCMQISFQYQEYINPFLYKVTKYMIVPYVLKCKFERKEEKDGTLTPFSGLALSPTAVIPQMRLISTCPSVPAAIFFQKIRNQSFVTDFAHV